jgi:hypothetical protein
MRDYDNGARPDCRFCVTKRTLRRAFQESGMDIATTMALTLMGAFTGGTVLFFYRLR